MSEGNIEYLMHIYKSDSVSEDFDAHNIVETEYKDIITDIVSQAHSALDT